MFTATTLVSLLAATASAVVIPPRPASALIAARQESSGTFSITNFAVAAQTGSDATYSFSVADHSTSNSSVSTNCFASTASSPGLATVPSTYCEDTSVYFDFKNNGTGYLLDIVHLWGEDVQHAIVLAHNDYTDFGTAFFPNSALVNGAAVGQPFLASIQSSGYFDVPYTRQS